MFDLKSGRRVERNLTKSTLQLNNAFSFSLSSYIRDNVGFSTSKQCQYRYPQYFLVWLQSRKYRVL